MSNPSAAELTVRIPAPVVQAKQRNRSGRSGGRIGLFRPVGIGQVALWELAIVAVVATVHPWRILSVVVASVAFVAVALTSVRWSGLCAYQWIAVLARFRTRRSPVRGTDPLGLVAPGVRFRRHIDRAGNRAGLVDLDGSLTAVVRLTPAANPNPAVLLDVLESTFERNDIRLAGAQLVTWAVPSPPRARYYGDQRDVEPMRVHWLALRYRQDEAPAAALARGGGDTGAARAVAAAAMAMAGRLAGAGHPGVVLDEPELRQELLVALGSDHPALGGAGQAEFTVRETWRDWTIGTLRQTTYQPRSTADGAAALGRLVPSAAFTCTSYSLHRTARGELRGESRIRVGLHPTVRNPGTRQIARMLGVDLLARDGRHGKSVVDCLPLAAPRV